MSSNWGPQEDREKLQGRRFVKEKRNRGSQVDCFSRQSL